MRRVLALALVLLSGLGLSATSGRSQAQDLDIVVENGRVYDGTGAPWIRADVGIASDRIIAVGDLKGRPARTRVDAGNLFVAPGFIDVHTHAGKGLATPELSHARPLLAQGLTTVFINPDGGGGFSRWRRFSFPGSAFWPPPVNRRAQRRGAGESADGRGGDAEHEGDAKRVADQGRGERNLDLAVLAWERTRPGLPLH
jgi:hypothetical protein